jgi:hypothetical protein
MNDELKAHLRAIEESNHRYREWMAAEAGDADVCDADVGDDVRFNDITMLCNIVASHALSAGEASWRRDQGLLGEHLRHTRGALVLALRVFNEIVAAGEQARAA